MARRTTSRRDTREFDRPGFVRAVELLPPETDDPPPADTGADDAYPFHIAAVRQLREQTLPLDNAVTFFVGENGSGKSTLLEAIAVAAGMNAEGGSRSFRFSTRATHSPLWTRLRLVRNPRRERDTYFLRAESFYTLSSEIEDLATEDPGFLHVYGGTSLHKRSHGEAFIALLQHRLKGNGLYLFDEPEAALSPTRQLAALGLMHDLVRRGSQFIVATHSPIIMAYPGATILQFSPEGVAPIAYEDTEHYAVTRMFLNDRETLLATVMSQEDSDD